LLTFVGTFGDWHGADGVWTQFDKMKKLVAAE
jgi:hypothetical protein